jgi:hypothetical protein
MTGRKRLILLATAMAALALPAVAEAKRGSIYDVTKATGFERMTFTGDAADCLQFAVCGYNGKVEYRISGKPKGVLRLTRNSKTGKVNGSAKYKTNGTTTATVTPPSGADCTDTVSHKSDRFTLLSSGSRFQSLLLAYHSPGGTDYLDSACTGPSEADAENANALPGGLFKAKDFFRGRKPSLGLSGGTPFRQGGFNATVEWNLKFKFRERDCSPRCKLPAGTP